MPCVRLRISGRVQGVYYRGWTVDTARALGLTGWVRNCPDGSVEAVAAGDADALGRFIEQCRRGPPAARVDSIEQAQEIMEPDLHDFTQRPDAPR